MLWRYCEVHECYGGTVRYMSVMEGTVRCMRYCEVHECYGGTARYMSVMEAL